MVSTVRGTATPLSPAPRPGTEPERCLQTGGNLGDYVRYTFSSLAASPGAATAESSASAPGLQRWQEAIIQRQLQAWNKRLETRRAIFREQSQFKLRASPMLPAARHRQRDHRARRFGADR